MTDFRADTPVQYVKGIGPQRAAALETLGVRSVGDLLEYFPFRYEEDLGQVQIADLQPGMQATIRGQVTRVRGRFPTFTAEVADESDSCRLRWFNQSGGHGLYVGAQVVATGKVQVYGDRLEMVQPSIRVYTPDAPLPALAGGAARQLGVYSANDRIKSPTIQRAVQTVLMQPKLPIVDPLPPDLLKRHSLPPREKAIRDMHAPPDDKSLNAARRRLAYEELFLMELAMALRRRKRVTLQRGQVLRTTAEIDRRIRARFPFALTPSQDAVIRDITRDLGSGRPMTRLVQGDVGSGKTVVALYACLVAIACGRQAAIMAPTEILAQQHFERVEQYLAGSRVRRTLLSGALSRGQRAAALGAIERGELDLIVGTQALLEKDVAFRNLAVVIVDEQHKFGVLQRAAFRTKGPMPHYLVMTATPIPRTLSMTVFGDLDVSIVKQPPPGRGRIITRVVTRGQWDTVMTYVRKRLEAGEQAYVVCPALGEDATGQDSNDQDSTGLSEPGAPSTGLTSSLSRTSDRRELTPPLGAAGSEKRGPTPPLGAAGSDKRGVAADLGRRAPPRSAAPADRSADLIAATTVFNRLRSGPWRELRLALLHGRMSPAEKKSTIAAFQSGKLHAVVSTTVVEVGVDVPGATIMIVENADRFGLSQLHQLRGRVGRGRKESLCVLIAYARSPKAAERLGVLAETSDGFRIAEADLRQRGPGELFGTRQHGLPALRVANPVDDFKLLEQARDDAFKLIETDPQLRDSGNSGLLAALRRVFGEKLALIDAA
ncbi:ATP-dependent DNA helicase RecG [Phycisphaerae bacterium RAS1]|nr:ATP-dependent DNA helicase RecG [Phycisphaerae bacterium RAS1]